MRILITGCNGFVGQHLLKQLPSDLQVYPCYHQQPYPMTDHSWYDLNVTDRTQVLELCEHIQPTHVIHLAAISHVPTAWKNPHQTWQVNLLGTLNLLEALKQVSPKAFFLHIGSGDCYGKSFNENQTVDENTPMQPLNPYATSKAASDLLAYQYACSSDLFIVRARPFNHIGSGQSDKFVISAFARQIAAIEANLIPPLLSIGNIEVVRDFLDVQDIVKAYIQILFEGRDRLTTGEIINLSSGIPRKIKSILNDLLQLTDKQIQLQINPTLLRKVDIEQMTSSASKLRHKLSWSPQVRWADTLQSLLNYWRSL